MSHPLTAHDLLRYILDYARLRWRQTNGSVSPDELSGIYGFGDFLVLMTQVHGEEDCPACPPAGAPLHSEAIADDVEQGSRT